MKQYVIKWLETQKRWQCNAARDDGTRKTFTSSVPGREGKAVVTKKVHDWTEDGINDRTITVEKLMNEWLENKAKSQYGIGQYRTFKSLSEKWVIPVIGKIRLVNLHAQHLQNVIDHAVEGGLKKYTVANIRGLVSRVLKYARKSNRTKLTMTDVEAPRDIPTRKKIVLDVKHLKVLFSSDNTTMRKKEAVDRYIHAYRAFVLSGLRPGELTGLTWDDLSGSMTHVNGSINQNNEPTPGKNKRARRTFINIDLLQLEYEAQREMLRKEKMIIPCISDGKQSEKYLTKYVFPDKYGSPTKQHTLLDCWKRYAAHNGLPEGATLYSFRYSFVSHNKNMPEEFIKSAIGHGGDMDTYKIYGQELSDDMKKTRDMINQNFNDIFS